MQATDPPLPISLFSRSLRAVENRCVAFGGKAVHARALRRAVLRGSDGLTASGDGSAVLPAGLSRSLEKEGFVARRLERAGECVADDGSIKLALRLPDSRIIETVVMRNRRGHSVCISTQVGCPVGCVFCASGIGGLARNLEPFEMIEQFAWASSCAPLHRAVIMGIGEPLQNLEALLEALEVITLELPLPQSRIVISTIGWPDKIVQLMERRPCYRLAVSLHAADDPTRARLVPSMRGVPVKEIIAAAREYSVSSGHRVQFEYVLLKDVNDRPEMIDELVKLLEGMNAYVNLIPWNRVEELPFEAPDESHVASLIRRAKDRGILATHRRSAGRSAQAACGQLRRNLDQERLPAALG